MRKPVKRAGKGAATKPEDRDNFPAGRAWERIEQFRLARGLGEVATPVTAKPKRSAPSANPLKPAVKKTTKGK